MDGKVENNMDVSYRIFGSNNMTDITAGKKGLTWGIALLVLLTNATVIAAMVRHRDKLKQQARFNVFLLSMTFTDLCSSFIMPWQVYRPDLSQLLGEEEARRLFCQTVLRFLSHTFIYTQEFHIVFMSLDRLLVVYRAASLKQKTVNEKKKSFMRVFYQCAACWLLGALFGTASFWFEDGPKFTSGWKVCNHPFYMEGWRWLIFTWSYIVQVVVLVGIYLGITYCLYFLRGGIQNMKAQQRISFITGYITLVQFAMIGPYAPVFVSEYFLNNYTYRILAALFFYIGSIVNCLFFVYIKPDIRAAVLALLRCEAAGSG